jgi:hypothetical protein
VRRGSQQLSSRIRTFGTPALRVASASEDLTIRMYFVAYALVEVIYRAAFTLARWS